MKRFAGGSAVLQVFEVKPCQVMQHQHTVDCRRRAKGGDLILLKNREQLLRMELAAHIENENARTCDPLPEVIAPDILAPAGIGYGEMHVAGTESVPESGGNAVPDRIGVIMKHQFRNLAGAGSEQHQHRIAGFTLEGKRVHDPVT